MPGMPRRGGGGGRGEGAQAAGPGEEGADGSEKCGSPGFGKLGQRWVPEVGDSGGWADTMWHVTREGEDRVGGCWHSPGGHIG